MSPGMLLRSVVVFMDNHASSFADLLQCRNFSDRILEGFEVSAELAEFVVQQVQFEPVGQLSTDRDLPGQHIAVLGSVATAERNEVQVVNTDEERQFFVALHADEFEVVGLSRIARLDAFAEDAVLATRLVGGLFGQNDHDAVWGTS